eukprot:537288-Rhodomonas_salina.1
MLATRTHTARCRCAVLQKRVRVGDRVGMAGPRAPVRTGVEAAQKCLALQACEPAWPPHDTRRQNLAQRSAGQGRRTHLSDGRRTRHREGLPDLRPRRSFRAAAAAGSSCCTRTRADGAAARGTRGICAASGC